MRPDYASMYDKAARTHADRRPHMEDTITDILNKYPWLKLPRMVRYMIVNVLKCMFLISLQFLHEMTLVTGVDIEKAIVTKFSPLVPGIIQQAPRSPLKTAMLAMIQGCLTDQERKRMSNSDDYSFVSSIFFVSLQLWRSRQR
jgi:hypothetical protein